MNTRGRRTQRRQKENREARAEGRAPGWRQRDRDAAALVAGIQIIRKIKSRRKRAR